MIATFRTHVTACALVALAATAACHKAPPATTPAAAASMASPAPATPAHAGTAPHWGYDGTAGPAAWAGLSPGFAACAAGRTQSPIDIVTTAVRTAGAGASALPPLRFGPTTRMAVPVSIVNNGHTVQVDSPGSSALLLGEDRYVLKQFHVHSPSEHTVDGRSFPLEVHFVHMATDGRAAVLGVLYEEGAENAALAPFWAKLPARAGVPVPLDSAGVAVAAMLPAGREVYRYAGSLTTPPCSEGVAWAVLKDRGTVSAAQVAAFRAVVEGNHRPPQPLNRRLVVADRIQ
jgi:carbonic anhydrase